MKIAGPLILADGSRSMQHVRVITTGEAKVFNIERIENFDSKGNEMPDHFFIHGEEIIYREGWQGLL
jgi:hypothetical protein